MSEGSPLKWRPESTSQLGGVIGVITHTVLGVKGILSTKKVGIEAGSASPLHSEQDPSDKAELSRH